MKFKLVQFPKFIDNDKYNNAINRMCTVIKELPGVVSIYQIGSVSSLGISDIDMVLIFKDGQKCSVNLLDSLSIKDRYLFVHDLYGIPSSLFYKSAQFTFFHNYKHLWGKIIYFPENSINDDDIQILKKQVAMEYLLKMYISLTIELTYGIVKVRKLLLHCKALLFDYEFLKINNDPSLDLLKKFISIRESWFELKEPKKEIEEWLRAFYPCFRLFIQKVFAENQLFINCDERKVGISRNVNIQFTEVLDVYHKGVTLPPFFCFLGCFLGRKYFNIQHRFNFFDFKLPFEYTNFPKIISEYFNYIEEINNYKKMNLPHFLTLTSSLNI